jgi:hypothetical protein
LFQALPMPRANFPIKYLGLPLSVRRLRKIEFRPLLDKAVAKITGWYGRHLTQSGEGLPHQIGPDFATGLSTHHD